MKHRHAFGFSAMLLVFEKIIVANKYLLGCKNSAIKKQVGNIIFPEKRVGHHISDTVEKRFIVHAKWEKYDDPSS